MPRLGRKLEEKILGKPSNEAIFVKYTGFAPAIKGVIERGEKPQTEISHKLFLFVSHYLMTSYRVDGELSFYNAVDSRADAWHGVDAFFRLKVKDEEFLVLLDFFHLNDYQVLQEVLASNYPERFDALGRDIAMMKWAARNLLITHYSDFQDLLYRYKRNIRGKENIERSANRFVLVPFDINRGRGLRALGRSIALSFKEQIYGKD